MNQAKLNALREEDPVAAKWIDKILEIAGNTVDEAQFSILETAGRIAAQFERETQGIQINIEQLTAKLHDS